MGAKQPFIQWQIDALFEVAANCVSIFDSKSIILNIFMWIVWIKSIKNCEMSLKKFNNQYNFISSDDTFYSTEDEAHLHCLLKVTFSAQCNFDI